MPVADEGCLVDVDTPEITRLWALTVKSRRRFGHRTYSPVAIPDINRYLKG